MAKYKYGTEFQDKKTGRTLKVVNYDDCEEIYLCKCPTDTQVATCFRTEEEIAKCLKDDTAFELDSNMSTEELLSLRDAITEVLEKRSYQKKEKLWRAMIEAMDNYANEFGDIYILTPEGEYNCCRADYSDFGNIQF